MTRERGEALVVTVLAALVVSGLGGLVCTAYQNWTADIQREARWIGLFVIGSIAISVIGFFTIPKIRALIRELRAAQKRGGK